MTLFPELTNIVLNETGTDRASLCSMCLLYLEVLYHEQDDPDCEDR